MIPILSRLHIRHRTTYRYSGPVRFGMHQLVLRPHEGHRFTVYRQDLRIEPEATITWRVDVHGNHVAYASIAGAADRLCIENNVTVDVIEDPPPESPEPLPEEPPLPAAWLQTEEPLVTAYQKPVWPEQRETLKAWLRTLPEIDPAAGALDVAQGLISAIRRSIRYLRRPEFGVQSPGETLEIGTGSCRDLATVALEAARALGLPARFVSGYLQSEVSAAGRGSTHAWVEFYCPSSGWLGFDPTVGRRVGPSHIATGLSGHPRGVMPISGTFAGGSSRSLGMKVEVTIRRETNPAPHRTADPPGSR